VKEVATDPAGGAPEGRRVRGGWCSSDGFGPGELLRAAARLRAGDGGGEAEMAQGKKSTRAAGDRSRPLSGSGSAAARRSLRRRSQVASAVGVHSSAVAGGRSSAATSPTQRRAGVEQDGPSPFGT
jgi:hypothetical protein